MVNIDLDASEESSRDKKKKKRCTESPNGKKKSDKDLLKAKKEW